MFYKPHTLQKKILTNSRDEYNRKIAPSETWVNVCSCRCDDNTVTEFTSENGHVYRPQYHVVCEGRADVSAGDFVRCINADGSVRGEGVCQRPKKLNYLNYSELWM